MERVAIQESRIARDGMAYNQFQFDLWYGHYAGWRMWQEASYLEYPGTPPDAMEVSDIEGLVTIYPLRIVCVAMDGTQLPLDCDGRTSIGCIRSDVALWRGIPKSNSIMLYHNRNALYPMDRFDADVLWHSDDYCKAVETFVDGEYVDIVVIHHNIISML